MNTYFTSRRTKKAIYSILALVIFALISFLQQRHVIPSNPAASPTVRADIPRAEGLYPVTSIVDGDTIKVAIGSSIETVRLIGIDTPETVDPRQVVQCFGKEASEETKKLVEGRAVRLVIDHTQDEKDRYDRLLRYVQLEDGTDINQMLIANGYAYEYTYDKPYQRQDAYRQAQKEAEVNQRGLWSSGTCAGKR
jgi:micrococcal nuclease